MSFQTKVNQMLDNIGNMCTKCSECCKQQFFHLTDIETPIIAQHLFKLGGRTALLDYLRVNETEFNVFTKYLFHFEENCPFLNNNQCTIYSDRPFVCRLFPLQLLGFFDDSKQEVRLPILTILNVKEIYDCKSCCDSLNEEIMRLDSLGRGAGSRAKEFLAIALLNKKNVGYLFGQRRVRGGEQYFPTKTGVFTTLDIQYLVQDGFRSISGHLPDQWHQYSRKLDDSEVKIILSDKYARKSTTKTGKRIRNIEEFHQDIFKWFMKSHGLGVPP